jgi:hypothetical protein
MLMSTNKTRKMPESARTMMCRCCGRIIIFVRRSDVPMDTPRYVAIYAKNWDGNPWYAPGVHKRHPWKRYARRMAAKEPPKDPFFSLD